MRLRDLTASRPSRSIEPASRRESDALAGELVSDEALGRMGRGRAAHRGDVIEQTVVRFVSDRRDHRDRQEGHGSAEHFVAECAQQVDRGAAPAANQDHLDAPDGDELLQGAADLGRGTTVLDRDVAEDELSSPPSAGKPGEHVGLRRRALGGNQADPLRQSRQPQLLLRLKEACGIKLAAQPGEACEQVPLPRQPNVCGAEAPRRRGDLTAGVVVRTAGDDHAGPVADLALGEIEPLEDVAPQSHRNGAVAVAQLEVDSAAADLEVNDLALEQDLRPLPHPLAHLCRIAAHRERAREVRVRRLVLELPGVDRVVHAAYVYTDGDGRGWNN